MPDDFAARGDDEVRSLAVQADRKILVGALVNQFGPVPEHFYRIMVVN